MVGNKMRAIIVLVLFGLAACSQGTEEQKERLLKAQEIEEIMHVSNKEESVELSELELVDKVLQQLNLNKENVATEFLSVHDFLLISHSEKFIVIPEVTKDDDEETQHNSHIVIADSKTGEITNKYFESAETNGWDSNALILTDISIDVIPYSVTEGKMAFGVKVRHATNSKGSPYTDETLSLFVKSGEALKKVLSNYEFFNYSGETDNNCKGEFKEINNLLSMSQETSNGYFDILVNRSVMDSFTFLDSNGECIADGKMTEELRVLKFDGKTYQETK